MFAVQLLIELLITKSFVRSEIENASSFLFRRCGTYHAQSEQFGNLHCGSSDTACCCMDQNRLTDSRSSESYEGVICSQILNRKSGGFDKRHRIRKVQACCGVDAHALRMRTTGRHRHHARSGREGISCFDHACRFQTRNVRRLWSTGIQTFALHDVGIIQAARFDANANLARLWLRIAQLDQLELVDASECFNLNCFHLDLFCCAIRPATYSASRAMPRR